MFDPRDDDTALSFVMEASMYVQLVDAYGDCVPPLLALGRLPHTGAPALALPMGEPVPKPLPQEVVTAARVSLQTLHAAGFCHGDVRCENLLKYGSKFLWCDLETCTVLTESGRIRDSAQLAMLAMDDL